MHYRVAYDVLQEAYDPRFDTPLLVMFLLALFMTVVSFWMVLRRGGEPDRWNRGGGTKAGCGLLVLPVFVLVVGWLLCRPLLGQRQAKAWAGVGDYEITEGTVAGLGHPRKGGTFLKVADVPFYYYPPDGTRAEGGFHGTFTDPGIPADALRLGLPVRIAHHGGVILRIEITAPEGRGE
jgi:hypothetical protein